MSKIWQVFVSLSDDKISLMKPHPQYDFPINIWNHVWEVEQNISHLFEGIVEVILNYHRGIMFVPEIQFSKVNWTLDLFKDIDDVESQFEARAITIAMHKYSVTPNLFLAGQEEKILPYNSSLETKKSNLDENIIFYVSSQEFDVFSNEIKELSKIIGKAPSTSRPISELKNYQFAKFLLDRVISSKHFSQFDLWLLGRGDKPW